MPYQIKNGIIYSGNAVTLTQAQYDALTTAEKNNGTVYYIYDSDAMIEAQEVGLDGGNVETLAGSVATFESSPSTAVHDEGEYILYQAQLYKVTSAIAVGEDLTVGSNIEATNLGNELNNGLTAYTDGVWTVRKYDDGTAECWSHTTISTNINQTWGSWYINAENTVAFPSGLFVSLPVITISTGGTNNSIPFLTENTTKNTLAYRVARPASQNVASVTLHAHAIGRWK